jgi:hypothetical protein
VKKLSMRAAQRCEAAKTGRCRCRCGGLLHGAARGMDEAFFAALPDDDPHKAVLRREPKKRVLKRDRVPPLFEGMEV